MKNKTIYLSTIIVVITIFYFISKNTVIQDQKKQEQDIQISKTPVLKSKLNPIEKEKYAFNFPIESKIIKNNTKKDKKPSNSCNLYESFHPSIKDLLLAYTTNDPKNIKNYLRSKIIPQNPKNLLELNNEIYAEKFLIPNSLKKLIKLEKLPKKKEKEEQIFASECLKHFNIENKKEKLADQKTKVHLKDTKSISLSKANFKENEYTFNKNKSLKFKNNRFYDPYFYNSFSYLKNKIDDFLLYDFFAYKSSSHLDNNNKSIIYNESKNNDLKQANEKTELEQTAAANNIENDDNYNDDSNSEDNTIAAYNNKTVCDNKILYDIRIIDNKYVSDKLLKQYLSTKKDDIINEKQLKENIDFINLNPFRDVKMLLVPKTDESSEIELLVKDKFPLRIYLGIDNTGLKDLDRNRLFAGFDWNNAFAIDSILSYQYTTSDDFHKFQDHTGRWKIFLPWKHILSFFGDYTKIAIDHMIPEIIKNEGFAAQASTRYDIILPSISSLKHNVLLGFDFKRTDTNLVFSRFLATNDIPVNLTQFLISYGLKWENNFYTNKTSIELYFSPGEWLSDQENSRYAELRRFAKNQYIYMKGYSTNIFKLPKDFLLSLMLSGQIANENLLPSETFFLGGFNTIRGYYENEITTDNGFIINTEIRTPPMALFKYKKIKDELKFIAFLDYGYGSLHQAMPFEKSSFNLLGCGPGVRYTIDPYLSFRLDLGIRALKSPVYNDNYLIHFGFDLSY